MHTALLSPGGHTSYESQLRLLGKTRTVKRRRHTERREVVCVMWRTGRLKSAWVCPSLQHVQTFLKSQTHTSMQLHLAHVRLCHLSMWKNATATFTVWFADMAKEWGVTESGSIGMPGTQNIKVKQDAQLEVQQKCWFVLTVLPNRRSRAKTFFWGGVCPRKQKQEVWFLSSEESPFMLRCNLWQNDWLEEKKKSVEMLDVQQILH